MDIKDILAHLHCHENNHAMAKDFNITAFKYTKSSKSLPIREKKRERFATTSTKELGAVSWGLNYTIGHLYDSTNTLQKKKSTILKTSEAARTLWGDTCKVRRCQATAKDYFLCGFHLGEMCKIPTCSRRSVGTDYCARHGGKKVCDFVGCYKGVQSHGRCKVHGGGARCQYKGCEKASQGGGFCRTHGGGTKCKAFKCCKGAQRYGYCYEHGGILVCNSNGCMKPARSGGVACTTHSVPTNENLIFGDSTL